MKIQNLYFYIESWTHDFFDTTKFCILINDRPNEILEGNSRDR